VRQRIAAELAVLHAEEEEVRRAMREALEKENLGREKALSEHAVPLHLGSLCIVDIVLTGDESTGSRGTLSLSEDIEAVKTRVERYVQRRALAAESGSAVEDSRKAVVQCYKLNPERPLDCWKEVEQFRAEVAKLENVRFPSLRRKGMCSPSFRNS
jgi:MICOS complex subunit MIC19